MSIQTTVTYDVGGNFTFDSAKIEITGGLARLKDQRPANATFGATYTSSINGNWGGGTLAGTATGGAAVAGGKLDLAYNDIRHVDYAAVGNADSTQAGCIRFKYTPNYSGSPAASRYMLAVSNSGSAGNLIVLYHASAGGNLTLGIFNSSAGSILNLATAWSPSAGVEYEIEVNWDITSGATRVFINGTQLGSTSTATGTRTAPTGLLRVGVDRTGVTASNFKIDDFVVFSTVQHTANYTPGYTLPETIYVTDDPTIVSNSTLSADALNGFSEVKSASGSDEVKYTLVVSGTDKWWTGAAWATSNGTYAEANTAADIETNKSALDLSAGVTLKAKAFLHSATGATRPTLTSNTITYDYFGVLPSALAKCVVWGYVIDAYGNVVSGVTVTATQVLATPTSIRNYQIFSYTAQTVTTNAQGYWEMEVVQSAQFVPDLLYNFRFVMPNGLAIEKRNLTVPALSTQEFNSLV